MFNVLIQNAGGGRSLMSKLRHLGAFGLFVLAILDSSPIPTFGGPDILIAILVSTRQLPWYGYAAVATAGSTVGAYLTFRLARSAGEAYLDGKFGKTKVSRILKLFKKWGTGSLIASSAIPFPFPTSMLFAAAGASDYHLGNFLVVVSASRAFRYSLIALITEHYGRHFVRMISHPTQNWGWLLAFSAAVVVLIGGGIFFNKRLTASPA
jgi:membrane protein YqaA with SNARE-associated domain